MKKIMFIFLMMLLKTVAFAASVILAIIDGVLVAAILVFRLFAVPVALVATGFVIISWVIGGFDPEFFFVFGAVVVLAALYYLLPFAPAALEIAIAYLRAFLAMPILDTNIIRSLRSENEV